MVLAYQMRAKREKHIIGKDDIADFPSFNLNGVRVKVDSGAYTSTIHCKSVKLNNEQLEVVFLGKKEPGYTGEKQIFNVFSVKKVRSSSGQLQERYTIKGNIVLFGKKYNTEFTLSSRTKMRYPVLLGRKLLNKRFLIDTSLSNQSWEHKNKQAE